jgi:predicted AAA+ superfamily ATPase
VEGAVARLRVNTEAFLAERGSHHTLLYGPRGSGKSTALRSLGGRYAAAGLRLIEVLPESLGELPQILGELRGRPHRYLLFVDDLSFEAGSGAYGPLKSLLEGSLGGRPENALVYATSNRRHLVGERFSERPGPLNDDVHAWDTQHERLALADRFGLVITFPDTTQRRYLEIVRSLAERDGLTDADLDAKAVRFAEWGNGYSGRTAQQFLEALKSNLI